MLRRRRHVALPDRLPDDRAPWRTPCPYNAEPSCSQDRLPVEGEATLVVRLERRAHLADRRRHAAEIGRAATTGNQVEPQASAASSGPDTRRPAAGEAAPRRPPSLCRTGGTARCATGGGIGRALDGRDRNERPGKDLTHRRTVAWVSRELSRLACTTSRVSDASGLPGVRAERSSPAATQGLAMAWVHGSGGESISRL